MVYAQIAVSAADDKSHTADDAKWPAEVQSYGNESRLSPSATIFRVLHELPKKPQLPILPGRLYATPADYHDRSYTTFRFEDPGTKVRVHLLRALDESLFARDWLIRETRRSLDPVDPQNPEAKVRHLDCFPDGWDLATRQAAAVELNALAADLDYAGLWTPAGKCSRSSRATRPPRRGKRPWRSSERRSKPAIAWCAALTAS